MTDDEILTELAKLDDHQQVMTRRIWELAGSMRVCWICGENGADMGQLDGGRGYFCQDCYSIQMGLASA